jgi:hypothetical protein
VAHPQSISEYLTMFAPELGSRILHSFPPLQNVDDPVSPRLDSLLRKPFPAQALAIMGVVKRWQQAKSAAVVAECGTGKTLISLAAVHVHSNGKPYTAIAMVPPHLTEKWAREALLTIPGLRVFMIDGLRDTSKNRHCGVNEVKLRRGKIVREGLQTNLSELRLRRSHSSARSRWQDIVGQRPTLFVAGRDRAKLGYFWKHAYQVPESGRFRGCVVNPDTGAPVYVDDSRLCRTDFQRARLSEIIGGEKEDESGYENMSNAGKKLLTDYFNAVVANFADTKRRLGGIGRNDSMILAEMHTIPQPYLDWGSAKAALEDSVRSLDQRNQFLDSYQGKHPDDIKSRYLFNGQGSSEAQPTQPAANTNTKSNPGSPIKPDVGTMKYQDGVAYRFNGTQYVKVKKGE